MNDDTQGNPAIGMNADSFEDADTGNAGSSEDFFSALENEVNGAISDSNFVSEETPQPADPNIVQNEPQAGDAKSEELEQVKKRYSDSSREAQKMKAQLDELKPFMPVLEVMKKDSGLVDTVREYLISGGKPPESVSNQLKLPDDFVFDSHEAMSNPESNSAKVMDAYVNKMVENRTSEIINNEKKNAQAVQQQIIRKKQADDFKKKHDMGEDEFKQLVEQAKQHKITLDDIYYLLNKDKVSNSVANQTKEDMLTQMKNVRNIPQSQSGSNNAGTAKGQNDSLFDSLLGLDSSIDNLFDG